MKQITIHAHAKVNLTLSVGAKRPDGYHAVETVMTGVSLSDTVTLTRCAEGEDTLLCAAPMTQRPEDDLTMRALATFFRETGITREDAVTIALEKRIPAQAGLGGGSSDAAAVLRGLRVLYAPHITDDELERMAALLGSDVPYFIRGGTALATGRGEVMTALPAMPRCAFVIVKPEESYSTAAMYAAIDSADVVRTGDSDAVQQGLRTGDLAMIAAGVDNDFQRVLPTGSAVPAIVDALLAHGALCAQMTGSGSAVFGIYAGRQEAERSAAALRETYPHIFYADAV